MEKWKSLDCNYDFECYFLLGRTFKKAKSYWFRFMNKQSHILIVEDSLTQQTKLQLMLESENFVVSVASNGMEALNSLENNSLSLPDLVLADIVMPEMDGIELTAKINNNYEDIPVIILTAKDDEENLIKAFGVGVVDYLIKPFSQTALMMRIQNTLNLFRKNRETYQIFNTAPIGMRLIDKNFKILRINDTMCKILGLKREEMIGKKCYEYFCINCEYQKDHELTDIFKEGNSPVFETELEYTRPNGEVIVGLVTQTPFRDHNGVLVGMIESFRDVTQWKRAEVELQTMQNIRSVGFLAGGIAHDFNNILTGIYGNIELAKLKLSEDDESREYIEKAEKSLSRAKGLTQRLISFAHGNSLAKEILDMHVMVSEVLSFALAGSKIRPFIHADDNLYHVEVDHTQIQRVLTNLTVNAVEASDESGNLNVYLKNRIIVENELPDLNAGEYLELIFKDEGCGMSRDLLSQVFTPYFSTKHVGRGFGLAICYSIIDKHKGRISVESELGKGTAFNILLPAAINNEGDNLKQQKVLDDKEMPKLENLSVLVMDDEEMLLDLMTEFLKLSHSSVQKSFNGEEAIELYQKSIKNGKPYDLVILDLTIPGGMGGEVVVKKLLEINPDVKCIVSSGYSDNDIISNFVEYGFKEVISKPYTLENVQSTISKVVCAGSAHIK